MQIDQCPCSYWPLMCTCRWIEQDAEQRQPLTLLLHIAVGLAGSVMLPLAMVARQEAHARVSFLKKFRCSWGQLPPEEELGPAWSAALTEDLTVDWGRVLAMAFGLTEHQQP